jgi:hypothetical protein
VAASKETQAPRAPVVVGGGARAPSFSTIGVDALAGVTGGITHAPSGAVTRKAAFDAGMTSLGKLITAAGGQPPPPAEPRPKRQPQPHQFTWQVGFLPSRH